MIYKIGGLTSILVKSYFQSICKEHLDLTKHLSISSGNMGPITFPIGKLVKTLCPKNTIAKYIKTIQFYFL